MLFQVDPLATATIVEQLVEQVKAGVARGALRRGDRLPSVRELASVLSVNPKTIVKAYEGLQHERVIVRRHGAGCFVTDARPALLTKDRRKQLRELVRALLTDAWHLGCSAEEIRETIEIELGAMRTTGGEDS